MYLIQKSVVLLLIFLFAVFSCHKESFYEGNDAFLAFSTDTITFDTVFTNIGTATQKLMVYNPYAKSVKIANIHLAGKSGSPFIININGKPVNTLNNIEIYSKDSLYIFVQVFIDPTGQDLPLLFHDSLIFNINGNIQDVDLVAYGQDVHWLNNETIKTSTWESGRPYLIYGNLIVDSLETLTINKGVTVYCHRQSSLVVKGTLIVNGTFTEPVKFKGDRLEKDYFDIPGQWGGIKLNPGSKSHKLSCVLVENGISGIQIGSYGDLSRPDIELSNVIIRNMSYSGLLAFGATVKASNCIIVNAAAYTCGLIDGGDYEFYHCTVANYLNSQYGINREAGYPTLYISNYYSGNNNNSDNRITNDLSKADFYNTIVYGFNDNEIQLDSSGSAKFQYKFDYCLLKSKKYHDSIAYPLFTNNVWDKDPKFIKADSMNFQLDTLSAAINRGNPSIGILYPFDLKNRSRTADSAPDIGAYEWIERALKD